MRQICPKYYGNPSIYKGLHTKYGSRFIRSILYDSLPGLEKGGDFLHLINIIGS